MTNAMKGKTVRITSLLLTRLSLTLFFTERANCDNVRVLVFSWCAVAAADTRANITVTALPPRDSWQTREKQHKS